MNPETTKYMKPMIRMSDLIPVWFFYPTTLLSFHVAEDIEKRKTLPMDEIANLKEVVGTKMLPAAVLMTGKSYFFALKEYQRMFEMREINPNSIPAANFNHQAHQVERFRLNYNTMLAADVSAIQTLHQLECPGYRGKYSDKLFIPA